MPSVVVVQAQDGRSWSRQFELGCPRQFWLFQLRPSFVSHLIRILDTVAGRLEVWRSHSFLLRMELLHSETLGNHGQNTVEFLGHTYRRHGRLWEAGAKMEERLNPQRRWQSEDRGKRLEQRCQDRCLNMHQGSVALWTIILTVNKSRSHSHCGQLSTAGTGDSNFYFYRRNPRAPNLSPWIHVRATLLHSVKA
jgi:hypothetical protein